MTFDGAVVIVSYNSGASLRRCLASIEEHAPLAKVVVVDNASTDGCTDHVSSGDGRVRLLVNTSNVGFARAVNQGIAASSGELVLVLNPDAYLLPGAVDTLAAELAKEPACAIVGPQILNEDGSVQGSARGDPSVFTGLFGRTTLLTRLLPNTRLARHNVRSGDERGTEGRSFAVDWVSGACMLARRDALASVGGFDEGYFLYWEDADLCRRLRSAGRSIRYAPAARVGHTVGVSSRSAGVLAITAFHQSAYRYYATHVASGPVSRSLAWLALRLRLRVKLLRKKPS